MSDGTHVNYAEAIAERGLFGIGTTIMVAINAPYSTKIVYACQGWNTEMTAVFDCKWGRSRDRRETTARQEFYCKEM